jgi:CheY-like chemotaxis protein
MVPNAHHPVYGVALVPLPVRQSGRTGDWNSAADFDMFRPPRSGRRVLKLRISAMQRILLIDDDDAVRSAISLILDQEDYVVTAAEDGHAGLRCVEEASFDLAIVDMFMPGLDGIETITAIRALAPTLPIIATSGAVARSQGGGAADVLATATERGAAMVIHKPFRPRELLQAIAQCLATDPAAGGSGR